MASLIFTAGESVTCENGHPLYRTTRDLHRYGSCLKIEMFDPVAPGIERPLKATTYQSAPPCPNCRAPWIRVMPTVGASLLQIHFADGWRPAV